MTNLGAVKWLSHEMINSLHLLEASSCLPAKERHRILRSELCAQACAGHIVALMREYVLDLVTLEVNVYM